MIRLFKEGLKETELIPKFFIGSIDIWRRAILRRGGHDSRHRDLDIPKQRNTREENDSLRLGRIKITL